MKKLLLVLLFTLLSVAGYYYGFAITRSQLVGKWTVQRMAGDNQFVDGVLYLHDNGSFRLSGIVKHRDQSTTSFAGEGDWNVFCRHLLLDWQVTSVPGFDFDQLDGPLPIQEYDGNSLTMNDQHAIEIWKRAG